MSKLDEKIKQLGYIEKVVGMQTYCDTVIYENSQEDIEVEISWDVDDKECYLHARSLTQSRDWLGQLYSEPRGLSYMEITAFVAKIDEMRNRRAVP